MLKVFIVFYFVNCPFATNALSLFSFLINHSCHVHLKWYPPSWSPLHNHPFCPRAAWFYSVHITLFSEKGDSWPQFLPEIASSPHLATIPTRSCCGMLPVHRPLSQELDKQVPPRRDHTFKPEEEVACFLEAWSLFSVPAPFPLTTPSPPRPPALPCAQHLGATARLWSASPRGLQRAFVWAHKTTFRTDSHFWCPQCICLCFIPSGVLSGRNG